MKPLRGGDILFSHDDSLLAWAIRAFQQGMEEADVCYANHVGIMFDDSFLIEALTKVTMHNVCCYDGADIQVWRNVTWTDEDRASITHEAFRYVGRTYGYLKLAAHAVDYFLERKLMVPGVWLARRIVSMDRYPICSWVVAYAVDKGLQIQGKGGYRFGVQPWRAQPDDIHDYVVRHLGEWEQVR